MKPISTMVDKFRWTLDKREHDQVKLAQCDLHFYSENEIKPLKRPCSRRYRGFFIS